MIKYIFGSQGLLEMGENIFKLGECKMGKLQCSSCKADLSPAAENIKFVTCVHCHKSNKNSNFQKSAVNVNQGQGIGGSDPSFDHDQGSGRKLSKKNKDRITAIFILVVSVLMFSFFRGRGRDEISADLVGTWEWRGDSSWIYTFNDDGTGFRGLDGHSPFEWSIAWGNLRIECPVAYFGVYSERWTISITNDTLVLRSLQTRPLQTGGTFRYYRE